MAVLAILRILYIYELAIITERYFNHGSTKEIYKEHCWYIIRVINE
jgi:hypothetical protein